MLQPTISLRIDLDANGRIGPGKIELLERIGAQGSIAAAGRSMAMSYRRAWELVKELNALFEQPVVSMQVGGRRGGGASLTAVGQALVDRYRATERAALEAARIEFGLEGRTLRPAQSPRLKADLA